MEINVSEVMGTTPVVNAEERMFRTHKPSKEGAWARVNNLKNTLDSIQSSVNSVYVGDTEESWRVAYEMLYTAFKNCIVEENQIIARD